MQDTDQTMLATVRIARGQTQAALARASGVSQASLSKMESGLMTLDVARLAKIADALDVPVSLLEKNADFAGPQAVVFHRKRASSPVSAVHRLRATLDLVHLQVASLMRDAPPAHLPRIPLDDGSTTPDEAAAAVREYLNLAPGPVRDLVGALEAAGVPVLRRPLGSVKIDALMSRPPRSRPVVLLADHAPGDRQRFSTAHEVGHAVMHDLPRDEQESEADRFASALLMPAVDIASSLRELTLPRLAQLKEQWGVSMAALLRRAYALGKIGDFQYRRLNIELSQAGYRTREPIEIATEKPRLIDDQICQLIAAGATPRDLAERTWMTENDFRRTYLGEDLA